MSRRAVSPHTPTRGVTQSAVDRTFIPGFQSTLPRGECRTAHKGRNAESCFNPHSHAGSDSPLVAIDIVGQGFNPHSHAGSDGGRVPCCGDLGVSIHTPTRGVTLRVLPSQQRRCSFNPHSHAGSDAEAEALKAQIKVSIHTPTRGVTEGTGDYILDKQFQSTLPRGE